MMIRNLFFLLSVTAVALAALILSVFNYNPYLATNIQLLYFYISFWLATSGVIAIIIFYFKTRTDKAEDNKNHFIPSIRKGVFIGAAISALLLLQGMELLDWWVGVPVVIAIIFLELFFQTKKK